MTQDQVSGDVQDEVARGQAPPGTATPLPVARTFEAALAGRPPEALEPAPRLEVLRRALLSARARIRTLDATARLGPLPPAAAAKLAWLREEAARLRDTLDQISHKELAPDPD